jgi:AbiV family abortive infection protein
MSTRTTPYAIDKALLSELVRGAQKTFENAETLFREASVLREAGFLSRAYCLHQISLEECAKIEILGWHATSMFMGHKADFGKLRKNLESHAYKNRTNAYFLERSEEEEAAIQSGDFEGAAEAFSQMQREFHSKANIAKNASLYVDFTDGKFVAPNERIKPEMVTEIATLNDRFLRVGFSGLERLQMYETNPERIYKLLNGFDKRLLELKDEHPNDPVRALNTFLQEMLERMRSPD